MIPGHFASMTPIDSIVLFGPETPALFGPTGADSHVIWAGLACSPCVNALNHRFSVCNNNVCMQEITVERVSEMVGALLRSRRRDKPKLDILPQRAVEVTILAPSRESTESLRIS